jgi:hypothetical protein
MEGEAISEWLMSFRGTKTIIGFLRDYPGMGPLAPMFRYSLRTKGSAPRLTGDGKGLYPGLRTAPRE